MNLRPSGYEPDELPTAPPRDIIESYMVPKTGIEAVREYKSRRILSPVRLPVPPPRLVFLAPGVGFEPTTYRLTAECSTVELSRNSIIYNHNDIITHIIINSIPFLLFIMIFK